MPPTASVKPEVPIKEQLQKEYAAAKYKGSYSAPQCEAGTGTFLSKQQSNTAEINLQAPLRQCMDLDGISQPHSGGRAGGYAPPQPPQEQILKDGRPDPYGGGFAPVQLPQKYISSETSTGGSQRTGMLHVIRMLVLIIELSLRSQAITGKRSFRPAGSFAEYGSLESWEQYLTECTPEFGICTCRNGIRYAFVS